MYQTMDDSFHDLNQDSNLCTKCGKKYETRGGLRKHMLSKHLENNLKHMCPLCKKTFLEKHQLESHMIQHGSEKFKCSSPDCDKEFSSKTALKRHVVHFHDKKSYSCSTCNMVYSDKRVLKDHVDAVHVYGYLNRCRTCGKGFKWRASLSRHVAKKHSTYQATDDSFHDLNDDSRLCTECGKTFETRGGLRKHLLSKHDENKDLKHMCTVCKKTFLEKHQLESHLIQHGSEKFKCSTPDCDKEFSSKSALIRHVVHFHEKKSYSCFTCNMVYSDRRVLKDHVAAVHAHGYLHRCRTCGKGFKWRASLSRHRTKKHST